MTISHPEAGVGQGLARSARASVAARRRRGEQVVVVEGDGGGPELREPVGRLDRVEQRARGGAEHVDPCQPTVQRPNENLSRGVGVSRVIRAISCQERVSELVSTAASTRWTCSPSANEGVGSVPAAMSRTRSTTWWVKACS